MRGGSGPDGGELVAVELEQVVRRVHSPPPGVHSRAPSSLEALDLAVELQVGEHGLDERLASSIELRTELGGEHPAHERIHAVVLPGRAPARLLASGGTSTGMPRAAMFCIWT